MSEQLCKINLLDRSITIRTEEDLHYIHQLEERVRTTIEEVKSELALGDGLSIAIMTSIYLADENFSLKKQLAQNSSNKGEHLKEMQQSKATELALSNMDAMLARILAKNN